MQDTIAAVIVVNQTSKNGSSYGEVFFGWTTRLRGKFENSLACCNDLRIIIIIIIMSVRATIQ
jgi:hypothetical protein